MKIKELENLLSIFRSNIRFYEKQGLFFPERQNNNYRDYTEQDITILKGIIILRKMGFTIEEIKQIQNNELPFQEALSKSRLRLEAEIEQLNGSLNMINKISKEHSSFHEIDISRWWDTVNQSEKQGEKFIDVCKDYLELERNVFFKRWKFAFLHDFEKTRLKHGTYKTILVLLLLCILRGICGVIFRQESFLTNFLYPWFITLIGSAITFPIFILTKKAPKIAKVIITIIEIFIVLFFLAIILLFVYGIIRNILS